MIAPMLTARTPSPLVWTRFRRGGRWHANARMLVPRPDGTVGWAQVITSDARTRVGRELHVIRGRLATRLAVARAVTARRHVAARGNLHPRR